MYDEHKIVETKGVSHLTFVEDESIKVIPL